MTATLTIHFETDGDFGFVDFGEDLLDVNSSFYGGVIKVFQYSQGFHDYDIDLTCEGDADCCKYVVRDVCNNLICNGVRVKYTGLISELIRFLITDTSSFLWSFEGDMHFNDSMGGNYEGSYFVLDLVY